MLTGAPNFRDLGGLPARAGHRVREGRIYRSSQLSRLSAADIDTVRDLGIIATIDFRSLRERTAQPTPDAIRTAEDYLSPKTDTDFIFNRIFAKSDRTATAWAHSFATFYATMLEDYAPEFVALFRAIADGQLPLLFHCSAGKDRTGAASALLLDLLGVDRAEIVRDYLRSSALLDSDAHFKNMLSDAKLDLYAELPIECRQVMLGTDPSYLGSLFDALDAQFGSVRAYLVHHGLSAEQIDRIVDSLTEPVRSEVGTR